VRGRYPNRHHQRSLRGDALYRKQIDHEDVKRMTHSPPFRAENHSQYMPYFTREALELVA